MHKMRFDAQHQTSVSGREKHGPYDAVTVELLHASSPSRLLSRAPLARSKGRVHCWVVLTSTWWICYVGLFNVTFNSEKPDCHLKVAVGFSRSGPDFVHANTTVPTIITVVDVSTTHR